MQLADSWIIPQRGTTWPQLEQEWGKAQGY